MFVRGLPSRQSCRRCSMKRHQRSLSIGGLAKLQGLLGQANQAVKDAIAPLTGQIERPTVAARALSVGKQMENQTNPTADLKALGDAVDEDSSSSGECWATLAAGSTGDEGRHLQADWRQIQYTSRFEPTAQVQAQMAFARGLKEEIRTPCHGARGWRCEGVECAGKAGLLEALDAIYGEACRSGWQYQPGWVRLRRPCAVSVYGRADGPKPGGEVASSAWTLSAGGKSGWSVPDAAPFRRGLYRAGFDSHAHSRIRPVISRHHHRNRIQRILPWL